MASTADLFEVALARCAIAHDDVQLGHRLPSRWASLASGLPEYAVEVLGNREHVFFTEVKRWHAADCPLAAVGDDWNDVLAVLIGEDDLRSQQVRSALIAAAQVGAMAGATAHAVECSSASDHRGIACCPLLLWEVGALTAALAARRGRSALRVGTASLLSRGGRRILGISRGTSLDGRPQHARNRHRYPCLSHCSPRIDAI